MDKLQIIGNTPLHGDVSIGGAKNAVVAIIPATILAQGECILENVPRLTDVLVQCEILEAMGAHIDWVDANILRVDTTDIKTAIVPEHLSAKLRASYYLMGALLGRFGRAVVGMPGGCKIGPRPIDQHLKGFQAMGCTYHLNQGLIELTADPLVGSHVYMDIITVGGTINIMLAAAGAEGVTVIENAAREPEIIDLANFLNQIGVVVKGAGTGTIKIAGSNERKGIRHNVIPDRIEAGTFMIAAAASGGDVVIKGLIPRHMEPLTAKLRETGSQVQEGDDWIRVTGNGVKAAADVKTLPYPGFPTDLQQPLSAFLATCSGTSVITENIFENRFRHVDELKRMGANIKVEGRVAVIEGVVQLRGAAVSAHDLRASSALVVAGLSARGETIVSGLNYLERGYQDFAGKLTALGARIKTI
ncbi:MAG: UDP-N-acetylglucosamine 1-carboxyvinyltransferase [Firmicutes bacterium]|nr:UDP-N-acetylglucosamine 1-carboxyvinyltransferase [Bacillota bacterium]